MRLFFLFLLVLNLLFFAWIYTQPEKQLAQVPPLPSGLKTVELLSDSQTVQDEVPATEETSSQQSDQLVTEEPSRVCFTLGPFNDEAAVLELKSRLSEQVSQLAVRRRQEQEPHRYWVYLASPGSREKAIALGEELAGKKIRDYYVVRSGEKNNSVSLGHFREKLHADRRMKRLRALGYDVQMEVIYRQYNLYWLDYSVDSPRVEDTSIIQGYLVDGVTRLDRDCAQ